MIIRDAVESDMPSLLRMSREFYDTTGYDKSYGPFDDESAHAVITSLLNSGIYLVAEQEGGELVAQIGVLVLPYMFNRNMTSAHELVWYVSPSVRGSTLGYRMLKALDAPARERGVVAIQMMTLHNSHPSAAKLLSALGYSLSEFSYTKVL